MLLSEFNEFSLVIQIPKLWYNQLHKGGISELGLYRPLIKAVLTIDKDYTKLLKELY